MSVDYVEDTGSVLIVRLPNDKHDELRNFIIENETADGVNVVEVFRRYVALRPPHIAHDRLFINYRDGKCSAKPVGMPTISKVPCEIAKYLGMDPDDYTGHSFITSAVKMRTTRVQMR